MTQPQGSLPPCDSTLTYKSHFFVDCHHLKYLPIWVHLTRFVSNCQAHGLLDSPDVKELQLSSGSFILIAVLYMSFRIVLVNMSQAC